MTAIIKSNWVCIGLVSLLGRINHASTGEQAHGDGWSCKKELKAPPNLSQPNLWSMLLIMRNRTSCPGGDTSGGQLSQIPWNRSNKAIKYLTKPITKKSHLWYIDIQPKLDKSREAWFHFHTPVRQPKCWVFPPQTQSEVFNWSLLRLSLSNPSIINSCVKITVDCSSEKNETR